MSDEPTTAGDEPEELPPVAHDDIMKRLMDYQRRLREGLDPDAEPSRVSLATETDELVDLSGMEPELDASAAEPGPEAFAVEPEPGVGDPAEPIAEHEVLSAPRSPSPTASEPSPEFEARIARLERILDRLGGRIGDLRQNFQDMVVEADHRLAEVEDEIARARSDQPDET